MTSRTGNRERERAGTLSGRVMDKIGRRIVGGIYAAGEVLPPELALCAEFGLSRTPLREATKRLHAKGLISIGPRLGTRVLPTHMWSQLDTDVLMWRFETGVDKDLIIQVHEMRMAFEPEACRLAALHGLPEQHAEIREAFERMAALRQQPERVVEPDVAFHAAILTATRNIFMISIGASVSAALQFQFLWGVGRKIFSVEELNFHRDIRDSILKRDGDAAAASMRSLILLSKHTFEVALNPQPKSACQGSPGEHAIKGV